MYIQEFLKKKKNVYTSQSNLKYIYDPTTKKEKKIYIFELAK